MVLLHEVTHKCSRCVPQGMPSGLAAHLEDGDFPVCTEKGTE